MLILVYLTVLTLQHIKLAYFITRHGIQNSNNPRQASWRRKRQVPYGFITRRKFLEAEEAAIGFVNVPPRTTLNSMDYILMTSFRSFIAEYF